MSSVELSPLIDRRSSLSICSTTCSRTASPSTLARRISTGSEGSLPPSFSRSGSELSRLIPGRLSISPFTLDGAASSRCNTPPSRVASPPPPSFFAGKFVTVIELSPHRKLIFTHSIGSTKILEMEVVDPTLPREP